MTDRTSRLKKILVAVDGSPESLRAARHAIGLARATKAPLTAVLVVYAPAAVYMAGSPVPGPMDYTGALRSHMVAHAQRVLSKVSGMARKAGVRAETRILEGHVPTEISRFAEKGGFDLLVVGSRGLSKISKWLLGSVSGTLVHQARVSVMVVK